MNRKDFLTKSAAMSVALAGLPLAKKKKYQKTLKHYSIRADYAYPNKNITIRKFDLYLYHEAISGFAQASTEDKKVTLACYYYNNNDTQRESLLLAFRYKFTMSSVTKDKNDDAAWFVKTTDAERLEGDIVWPKVLPQNPTIRIIPGLSAEILNKKGEQFVKMNYNRPSTNDDFCFITTACVNERQMADDCDELNTLRFLRENYMRNTQQGKELLKEYEVLGPTVVTALSKCENRKAIYDYLYQHMILPAVSLIKNGKYQDAVDWYQGFSLQLKENYC